MIKALAAAIYKELEKDGWGEIDPYWFKMIAEGDLENIEDDDDEAYYAKELGQILDRAFTKFLNEQDV